MKTINATFMENMPAVTVGTDLLKSLTNTEKVIFKQSVKKTAKKITVNESEAEYNIEDLDWVVEVLQHGTAPIMYPADEGNTYRVKHPYAFKCSSNPEDHDYLVSGKFLGVICSLVVLRDMESDILANIKLRKERNLLSKVFSRKDKTAEDNANRIGSLYKELWDAIHKSINGILYNPFTAPDVIAATKQAEQAIETCVHNTCFDKKFHPYYNRKAS